MLFGSKTSCLERRKVAAAKSEFLPCVFKEYDVSRAYEDERKIMVTSDESATVE